MKLTAFGFFLVPALFGDTFTVSLLVVLFGSPSLRERRRGERQAEHGRESYDESLTH